MRRAVVTLCAWVSGAICLFLAVTLALSAGTLGLGPEGSRPDWWDGEWVKTRGGMVGETLDWGLETLFGAVGAHIVAVFLFIAGVLLLTGASVAGVRVSAGNGFAPVSISNSSTPSE